MSEKAPDYPANAAPAKPPLGGDFRLYAAGRLVSVVGDRIALIALVFLVIHESHASAPALAGLYVARLLPTLLGGLFAGVIVDLFDRKRLLIAADLLRAVLLAVVPVVAPLNLWIVYPLVFGLNAFTLLFDTAAWAALPDAVPEVRMTTANAILDVIVTSGDLFYALGGALVFALGYRAPFFIDAATFVCSAATIAGMRLPRVARGPLPDIHGVWVSIKEGYGYVMSRPFLKWSSLTFAFAPFAGGIAFVLTPLYANRSLAHGSWLFGPLRNGAFRFSVMEVALGVGALAGSAITAKAAAHYPRGRLFGIGMTGMGVAYGALGFTTNLYVAMACVALGGLFNSMFGVAGFTLIQALTPTEMRGRVRALNTTVISGSLAAGSALGGALLVGIPYSQLWVLIGFTIVVATLFIWLRPEVRTQL